MNDSAIPRRMRVQSTCVFATAVVWIVVPLASAWDEVGHIAVTRLAIHALPDRMPAWLKSPEVQARLEYLCNEPDRWRGVNNIHLDHINRPEHYMDEELLHPFGWTFETLPRLRRQYEGQMAIYRENQPGEFEATDPKRDEDDVLSSPGLLPYRVAELMGTIASSWTTLELMEKYDDRVTPDMLRNARENVIFHMGILSHYIGDGAQPLHTTKHYNGWAGPNPNGYTTSKDFHPYIDTGVVDHHKITPDSLLPQARPSVAIAKDACWPTIAKYLKETHKQVEPLYILEKSGNLKKEPGKRFIEDRLLAGGAMLAGVWITAHDMAGTDSYLENKLKAMPVRKAAATNPPAVEPAKLKASRGSP